MALYDALAQLAPSPVVELDRAVAVSMAFGPAAGFELVDALASEPVIQSYHLLPSVRGDLLIKLGRFGEAGLEVERAASLTRNSRERALAPRARWRLRARGDDDSADDTGHRAGRTVYLRSQSEHRIRPNPGKTA